MRTHTTADIIVPTLHWCVPHKRVWPDPETRNSHQDPARLRELCKKYSVEFVESRRELTQYMSAHGLEVEGLLVDSPKVHPDGQSPCAALDRPRPCVVQLLPC